MTQTRISRDELVKIIQSIGPRDFREFALRVTRIDPLVGETVRLHAEAADGNSPSLPEGDLEKPWVDGTLEDAAKMESFGATTVEDARKWWMRQYC